MNKLPPSFLSASSRTLQVMILIGIVCQNSTANAQFDLGVSSPVRVLGSASQKLPAETMRAILILKANGPNVKAADQKMNEKIDAAKAALTALGADSDGFQTDDLKVDAGTSNQHRRMMLQMRRQGFGGGPPGLQEAADEGPKMVQVSRTLVANWKLEKSGIDLLQHTFDLQAKINELSFDDDGEGANPEAAELMEEAQMFGGEEEAGPTKPIIVYAAAISPELRESLGKKAFADARAKAKSMSAIIGRELGDLEAVRTNGNERSPAGYSSYEYREMYGSAAGLVSKFLQSTDTEVVNKNLQDLELGVQMQVGYSLK